MKKIIAVVISMLMLCSCSGGISQSDYDAVVKERDELRAQVGLVDKNSGESISSSVPTSSSSKVEEPADLPESQPSSIKPAAPTERPETSESQSPSVPSGTTIGQKNALAKARDYLDYSAFSYNGLIEQLEYEKFSNSDATYAADNCGADWNEQATKKAKDYLEYSSFSRDGLIEQLEYEGFTYEQALYGTEQNGY